MSKKEEKKEEKEAVAEVMRPPRKVAMLGTAPSTRSLVPQNDEWELWTQADYWQDLKHVSRWFELAPIEKLRAEFGEYLAFLKGAEFPVFMRQHYPEIPKSQPFPFQTVEEKFGAEFMTATLCWMMGLAILEHIGGHKISHIGLWGYDMAMDSEYSHQRPGIRHMHWICTHHLPALGFDPIEVVVPKGSDLLLTPIPYPFAEDDQFVAKVRARKRDIQSRMNYVRNEMNVAQAKVNECQQGLKYLEGAMEDANYFERMFCGVPNPAA